MKAAGWQGIRVLAAGPPYLYDGLFKAVGGWADMIAISADGNGDHVVGLRQDGAAIAAGDNQLGQ